MSGEETVQGQTCACHPECEPSCRVEQHPSTTPCIWPNCLTEREMRDRLRELRRAGVT